MKICDYPLVGPLFEAFTDCDGGGNGTVGEVQVGAPNGEFQNAVPEPGGVVLFGLALVGVAMWVSLFRKGSE